ncbi:Hsp20/alpha crystallin family protein [Nitrosopumilus sp. Nsub]|uniref:Hsp20/alpha crystallin family protein n=1 Tax=Nitrosopumilus sp. Nsub TaxID=1776294 RepID=UPI00082CFAE9|nr:Hsp20/alpha crystallin family protein [Nitrosopumilus sp. Nsub]
MVTKRTPEKISNNASPWYANWGDLEKVFDDFRSDLERSFTSFPSIHVPQIVQTTQNSCDVIDEGNHYKVIMNMPGVEKKDIKLNVTDNSIEVSAEHKEESKEKKKNYLRKERNHVSYYRTLPFSEKIVSGKTNAKLTNGILEIHIPKLKPSKKQNKRSISIR